jgi:hypothetical protein
MPLSEPPTKSSHNAVNPRSDGLQCWCPKLGDPYAESMTHQAAGRLGRALRESATSPHERENHPHGVQAVER